MSNSTCFFINAGFYSSMGNYGSPSNAKFVPNQNVESFEKIIKASRVTGRTSYSQHSIFIS